jgi:hypothetical protein
MFAAMLSIGPDRTAFLEARLHHADVGRREFIVEPVQDACGLTKVRTLYWHWPAAATSTSEKHGDGQQSGTAKTSKMASKSRDPPADLERGSPPTAAQQHAEG